VDGDFADGELLPGLGLLQPVLAMDGIDRGATPAHGFHSAAVQKLFHCHLPGYSLPAIYLAPVRKVIRIFVLQLLIHHGLTLRPRLRRLPSRGSAFLMND
jgi:hypothetical protein